MRFAAVKAWWREAGRRRSLLIAAPWVAVVLAAAAGAIGLAVTAGSGSSEAEHAVAPTATSRPATSTRIPATPTVVPTETPASAGLQHDPSGPPPGQQASGGRPVQPRAGTGPGAAIATNLRLTIPRFGVNAPVYSRTMGSNGVMGDPLGAWDVIWYDFSQNFPGLGGYPGEPGANAVFSGHVDYIHIGPAVFWNLRNLQPGDQVTVQTPNGPITYAIQWSKWIGPSDDFTPYVSRTGQDVITMVTCIGSFSAGHYSNRIIVRGVRI